MLKLFYKILLLFILLLAATLLYQKNTYAYHTLVHIDPLPHTKALIEQKQYADAYHYLHYFIDFDYMKNNKEAHTLLKKIETIRSSFAYQSNKILEGIRTGTSDELSGQASAIGSDFFVIGDIRDLYLQAKHYFKDEKVDNLLVALSGIGLMATAGTLVSGGSSTVVKGGISVLKLAQKSKRIPAWLNKFIIRESKEIRKTKNLSRLTPLFDTLQTLRKQTGLPQTLNLLSQTKSLKELQSLAKLSKRYGKSTATLLKLSDKQILTQSKRLKDIDIQTIQLASTYGTSGFVHLIKGGEKNFLKTTKRMKAYSKVGYKGEIWKIALWLMKHVSDTVLILMMSFSSLLLLPWRRLIKAT